MNQPTSGEKIAAAISPFLTSKTILPREEAISIVSKPIDRLLQSRDIVISKMVAFLQGEAVTITGLTYRKGVNDSSFLQAIEKMIKSLD